MARRSREVLRVTPEERLRMDQGSMIDVLGNDLWLHVAFGGIFLLVCPPEQDLGPMGLQRIVRTFEVRIERSKDRPDDPAAYAELDPIPEGAEPLFPPFWQHGVLVVGVPYGTRVAEPPEVVRELVHHAEPLYLRTKDAPTANGATPAPGSSQWTLDTELEDGRRLFLTVGQSFYDNFRKMLLQEMADDAREIDGSGNSPV